MDALKDEDVVFDRRYHVLYSKECKEEILKKIALHYSADKVDEVFENVQIQDGSWGKRQLSQRSCGNL